MRIRAVALNTFREAIRDKILYTILIFALAFIGGSTLLATLTFGEQTKIIIDLGLASINLFGVMMAIFLGIGLVSKEIEKRTLYTVLAKPVGRVEFLLGKYGGLLLVLLVNTTLMGVMLYLTWAFNQWRIGLPMSDLDPRLLYAMVAIYLELTLLSAVALFFSSFTTVTLASFFTLSIYVIGHTSGDLVALGKKQPAAILLFLKGLYYLFPNFANFDIKGKVAHSIPIEWTYFALILGYALAYSALFMGAASVIFKRRDLK